ncbi:MAG: penicillin-insensitive murein endopeptidase [Succinivibrio sp.]
MRFLLKLSVLPVIAVFFLTSLAIGSEVIGSYANGCIIGAKPFKPGANYQIQKWSKDRFYGHPELIDYLEKLVKKAKLSNLPPLLIGDLSRPNGGPFPGRSNHNSHQTGLDVDISFDFARPKKTEYELTHPKDVYLVDVNNRKLKAFDSKRIKLIYLAASDSRVERIFVAPGIKKVLCDVYKDKDTKWLSKIRPWFGHRGHMHVRLACPKDSEKCISQSAVPDGDGCGSELESWLKPQKKSSPKPKVKKILPEECQKILGTAH